MNLTAVEPWSERVPSRRDFTPVVETTYFDKRTIMSLLPPLFLLPLVLQLLLRTSETHLYIGPYLPESY